MDVFARAKIDSILDFKGASFGLASQEAKLCCYQMMMKMKDNEPVDELMEKFETLQEAMHV